jgi:hypothetical protein
MLASSTFGAGGAEGDLTNLADPFLLGDFDGHSRNYSKAV